MSRKFDLRRSIAVEFENSPHHVSPRMAASYESLKMRLLAQFEWMLRRVTVEFVDDDPYTGSEDMFNHFRKTQSLKVWRTQPRTFTLDHPMGEQVNVDWLPRFVHHRCNAHVSHYWLLWNDIFRAVHDYYGHCVTGHQFGPRGEDRAYRAHASMMPRSALPALCCETRCQQCWFHYGKHVTQEIMRGIAKGHHGREQTPYQRALGLQIKANYVDMELYYPSKDRPFAPQKVVEVPLQWTTLTPIMEE